MVFKKLILIAPALFLLCICNAEESLRNPIDDFVSRSKLADSDQRRFIETSSGLSFPESFELYYKDFWLTGSLYVVAKAEENHLRETLSKYKTREVSSEYLRKKIRNIFRGYKNINRYHAVEKIKNGDVVVCFEEEVLVLKLYYIPDETTKGKPEGSQMGEAEGVERRK